MYPCGQSWYKFLDDAVSWKAYSFHVYMLPSSLHGDDAHCKDDVELPVSNDLAIGVQAARKRPALANMLSHRWLRPPTPPSTPPSSAPSQSPVQSAVSATHLLSPPGPPLLTAGPTNPPEPSSLELIPTEVPGIQSMNAHVAEGRHHAGVSRIATAYEEISLRPELLAAHSDARLVFMRC